MIPPSPSLDGNPEGTTGSTDREADLTLRTDELAVDVSQTGALPERMFLR
jgi:hypothetical protein